MKQEIKVTLEELTDIWNHAIRNGYIRGYCDGNNAVEFGYCDANYPGGFPAEAEPLPSYIAKLFKDDGSRK